MESQPLIDSRGVHEVVVGQPCDGSTLSAHISKRPPHRHQVWIPAMQDVVEAPEGTTLDRPGDGAPGSRIAKRLGEVNKVPVPDLRG
jgi:hypothetical protein